MTATIVTTKVARTNVDSGNSVLRSSGSFTNLAATKMPTRIPFSRIFSTVEYRNLRFVILDSPTANTVLLYMEELLKRGVTDVVRLCEATYDKAILEEAGIKVHDWPFKDGGVPPSSTLHSFLSLCDERFKGLTMPPKGYEEGTGPVIAVHCVAGLGRAPVLVTAALVETGMTPLDAVEFVRRRRRGALNSVQLNWMVDSYKRQWKKGSSRNVVGGFLSKRASSPATPLATTARAADGPNPKETVSVSLSFKESFGRVFRLKKSNSGSSDA